MAIEKVKCKNCGRIISADMKFCPYCGIMNRTAYKQDPNKNYCVFCGSEIPDDAAECPICGTKREDAILHSKNPADVTGETIVFSEVNKKIDSTMPEKVSLPPDIEEEIYGKSVTPEAEEPETAGISEDDYFDDGFDEDPEDKAIGAAAAGTGEKRKRDGFLPIIGAIAIVAFLLFMLSPLAGKYQLTKLFSKENLSGNGTSTATESITAAPTETPAVTETPEPTETPAPTETPTPTPTETPTPTPTETPTPEPTETPTPAPTETPTPAPTETPTSEPTPQATPEPTPEPTAAPQPSKRTDQLFADTATRYISYGDLEGRSQQEVRLICNEVYARHGYIFKDQAYNDYFSQFAWYVPSVTKENFSDSVFNQYERENVHTIAHYEKDKGWR